MALTHCSEADTDELNGTHFCEQLADHSTPHRCECGHRWVDHAATRQGAPRQAGTQQQPGTDRQATERVEQLGVAVSVRQLTPASAGHAVRLVVDGPLWLDPADAHAIADAINAAALESIHADRAGRHA